MRSIVVLPVEKLHEAPWNYKSPGTSAMIDKLKQSIVRDKSAGVPAVREIDDGAYEVIDGNHRLVALRQLGWKQVPCENFGSITLAEAVVLSRRRNSQWFDDDLLALSKLFNDIVLPEIPLDVLSCIMPESQDALVRLTEISKFDWLELPPSGVSTDGLSVSAAMDAGGYALWERWFAHASSKLGLATKGEVLARALSIALEAADADDHKAA